MTKVAPGLDMMRRRRDFVAAAGSGVKIGGPLVALQMKDRGAAQEAPRVGFTATKRVGGAVERSRMKRRLREAARQALAGDAKAGCDYVLIARRAVLDAPFDRLLREIGQAVKRAHGKAGGGGQDTGRDKVATSGSRPRESGR